MFNQASLSHFKQVHEIFHQIFIFNVKQRAVFPATGAGEAKCDGGQGNLLLGKVRPMLANSPEALCNCTICSESRWRCFRFIAVNTKKEKFLVRSCVLIP